MKLTEERKEEVLALCKKLISIRSYSGEEKGVADALKDFMRRNLTRSQLTNTEM